MSRVYFRLDKKLKSILFIYYQFLIRRFVASINIIVFRSFVVIIVFTAFFGRLVRKFRRCCDYGCCLYYFPFTRFRQQRTVLGQSNPYGFFRSNGTTALIRTNIHPMIKQLRTLIARQGNTFIGIDTFFQSRNTSQHQQRVGKRRHVIRFRLYIVRPPFTGPNFEIIRVRRFLENGHQRRGQSGRVSPIRAIVQSRCRWRYDGTFDGRCGVRINLDGTTNARCKACIDSVVRGVRNFNLRHAQRKDEFKTKQRTQRTCPESHNEPTNSHSDPFSPKRHLRDIWNDPRPGHDAGHPWGARGR